LKLPGEPSHFDISSWTGRAILGYGPTGHVSVLDLASGESSKSIRISETTGNTLFRSDGRAVMVSDISSRQLAVLDSASLQTIVRLPLAVRPDYLCRHPDGGQIFITGDGADSVVVIYPYYVPQVAETVLAGNRPGPMAASDSHLFVTNPAAGDVTILSVGRRRVIAVAQVGTEPRHITLTPDGEYALVLNQRSGDMAVLRIAGLQPDRRKSAALFTMIPVGSKPVSAAVMAV
jgi:DNA-binding beta-propeller fold protein YncE